MTEPPVRVIAEAGVNHNGDPDRALRMIDAAADAGADVIKFQTFIPAALASGKAGKAGYQVRNEGGAGESQRDMLERLALPFDAHHRLQAHCRDRGIGFLSSPFDISSADFLIGELGLDELKLGSGELTNAPLLWHIASHGARLILSTGMATLDEVLATLGLLGRAYGGAPPPLEPGRLADEYRPEQLGERVSLMHCTTAYPCPVNEVKLRAMQTLARSSGLACGYSDHTRGIAVSLGAVAMGARMIEKHFTLDRNLPGPDHAASLEPGELAAMVAGIRDVTAALGSADKRPTPSEHDNALVVRKSLVAACPIPAGTPFSVDNVTAKRPAGGQSPMYYWQRLGQTARHDYEEDQALD